mmetsp:Transcript_52982/g.172467  ORF Transcript_52982/g.172467 Transcript_52982/m.172467 type:complete len:255 (+) Transcript_52982:875-1639(+)
MCPVRQWPLDFWKLPWRASGALSSRGGCRVAIARESALSLSTARCTFTASDGVAPRRKSLCLTWRICLCQCILTDCLSTSRTSAPPCSSSWTPCPVLAAVLQTGDLGCLCEPPPEVLRSLCRAPAASCCSSQPPPSTTAGPSAVVPPPLPPRSPAPVLPPSPPCARWRGQARAAPRLEGWRTWPPIWPRRWSLPSSSWRHSRRTARVCRYWHRSRCRLAAGSGTTRGSRRRRTGSGCSRSCCGRSRGPSLGRPS